MSRSGSLIIFDDSVRNLVFLLVAASALMVACVPVTETQDGRRIRATSDEFREYAASVFRRQNGASVALIEMLDAVEADDPALAQKIKAADSALQEDCADLNAAAITRRDGQQIDRSALRNLVTTIPLCDAATAAAEALLPIPDPGS